MSVASAPVITEPLMPHCHPRLAIRTPSSPTLPVSHGAVAFVAPPCHLHAIIYTVSSHCAAGETPHRLSCAGTVDVGQPLLCNWAMHGFGPVTVELIFLFSEYIQILVNSKICVGFV
jgi:hypothetical protein